MPGGTFTFNVVVTNTSNVPLTIRTLTDNIYGDITRLPGSTCNTAIGTVLAPSPGPGHTYSCRFQGDFRGPGGASQTDIVTVTATDNRGNTVRDDDDAIVRITPVPPSIVTVKSASPPSLQEPGGTFTFHYSVTNTGPEPVTITSLVDDEGTSVTAFARATVTLTPMSVPPVVQPPPPPPQQVQVIVPPRILVRTGGDLGGQIRLASALALVGMVLVAAAWKFGDGGTGGLVPLPAGPGGGPRGGGGGGPGLGGVSWFRGGRPRSPRGPAGGFGVGAVVDAPLAPTAPAPAPASAPVAPALSPPRSDPGTDLAWDDWVVRRGPVATPTVRREPTEEPAPIGLDPEAVVVEPFKVEPVRPEDEVEPFQVEVVEAQAEAEPEILEPEILEPEVVEPEVLVPTFVPPRATGALDAAALDAANELMSRRQPQPPPGDGRRSRRGR